MAFHTRSHFAAYIQNDLLNWWFGPFLCSVWFSLSELSPQMRKCILHLFTSILKHLKKLAITFILHIIPVKDALGTMDIDIRLFPVILSWLIENCIFEGKRLHKQIQHFLKKHLSPAFAPVKVFWMNSFNSQQPHSQLAIQTPSFALVSSLR